MTAQMNNLASNQRPAWFYMLFALGLFVTLDIFIGAQGRGNPQIPLLVYIVILGCIIAKYRIFRWRSLSVAIFSLLILYGAVASFVARAAGQEFSYFTAMGLGIIVISLHFLPKSAVIDISLIKRFLYYSGMLFVISRMVRMFAGASTGITDPMLFLTPSHEMAFLLPFVVLIPLFERKYSRTLLGLVLVAVFLILDFRTTIFLSVILTIISSMLFVLRPMRAALRRIRRILLVSAPVIGLALVALADNTYHSIRGLDRFFRDLLGRSDTQSFRESLNALAVERISENAWLGDLFQGHSISLQHYYFGVWRTDTVHNVFLVLGAQGGLLFLVPFIILLIALIVNGVRVAARFWRFEPEGARLLAVLVIALVSAVMSGMFNPFLGYAMGAFWFWTIIMLIYLLTDTLLLRGKNAVLEKSEALKFSRRGMLEYGR